MAGLEWEKDSKRKKKKDVKKTEDGIVRRLAKNGLIGVKEEEAEGLVLFIILLF